MSNGYIYIYIYIGLVGFRAMPTQFFHGIGGTAPSLIFVFWVQLQVQVQLHVLLGFKRDTIQLVNAAGGSFYLSGTSPFFLVTIIANLTPLSKYHILRWNQTLIKNNYTWLHAPVLTYSLQLWNQRVPHFWLCSFISLFLKENDVKYHF